MDINKYKRVREQKVKEERNDISEGCHNLSSTKLSIDHKTSVILDFSRASSSKNLNIKRQRLHQLILCVKFFNEQINLQRQIISSYNNMENNNNGKKSVNIYKRKKRDLNGNNNVNNSSNINDNMYLKSCLVQEYENSKQKCLIDYNAKMNEKKEIKISLSAIIIIIAVILICIMGVFLYKLNDEKITEEEKNEGLNNEIAALKNETSKESTTNETSSEEKTETEEKTITKDEALEKATETYTKAYNMFHSEDVVIPGEYNVTGESKLGYKINIKELENVFSERAIKIIKEKLIENNGEYYDIKTDENTATFFETTDVTSIFSAVDSGIRKLSIIEYTDNYIMANGKFDGNEHSDAEDVGHNIGFIKENGKWLIDIYE